MISAEHEEVLRVLDLETEHETDRLNVLASAIHIIAEEQVVDLRGESVLVEDTQQIRVLAVNVATDDDRWCDLNQWALAHKHLLRLEAQCAQLLLINLN